MAVATNEQIVSFIKTLSKLAINECNRRAKLGEPFVVPSVCMGMSAHETGWGTADIMVKANAYFGIKAGGSWTGKVYVADTWEVVDGESYNTVANFRAYDSLADSVRDYYDLICNNARYSSALSTLDNRLSAEATVTAIWQGGYATDPPYVELVMNLIRGRDLEQYDTRVDGITEIPIDTEMPYDDPIKVPSLTNYRFVKIE